MNNGDYIPLDQTVIDQEVRKSFGKRHEAKNVLRGELKDARGNCDIIGFPGKFKRIIKALNELKIFWCEVDGEIYANRHEVYDVLGE